MNDFLKQTFLNLPAYIWVLQFLYVGVSLAILFAFATTQKRATWEIIFFVTVMIIVNIAWRFALR